MEMTVKQAVLKAIITNYPYVKNYLIHNACPQHPLSGLQRMREIRKQLGAVYPFDIKTNTYNFSETPIEFFKKLLAGEEEKGKSSPIVSHPSPANTDYDFSERGLIPENKRFLDCFEIKEGELF